MTNLRPTDISLPGVLVGADLVGSSDFQAQTGSRVSLALEAYCYDWADASEEHRQHPVIHRAAPFEPQDKLLLTGVVLPLSRPCELGGWVLDLAGIPIHVTNAQDRSGSSVLAAPDENNPRSQSHYASPVPGTWVRIEGTVSIADDYVVDEVEQSLQRPVERPWLVQRIVRLVPLPGRGKREFRAQPAQSIHHTRDASSYLVDLAAA